ncbi:hypothetical protein C0V77_19135 [Emticicia sp. TH156]|nr:hypothetical protein C0V77_19135 [Emticicia sp. TH156]
MPREKSVNFQAVLLPIRDSAVQGPKLIGFWDKILLNNIEWNGFSAFIAFLLGYLLCPVV